MNSETQSSFPDVSRLRVEYKLRSLLEADADPDPLNQFSLWLNEAIAANVNEPNAMTLASVGADGLPSARIVLLKTVNADGLAFFTNYQSRKGQELEAKPAAALVFFWPELERQVRVEGSVVRTNSAESDKYFHRRPPEARLGSAASPQSQVIESRDALEQMESALRAKFPEGNVPRPAHWGGYRVIPTRFEFWQGRASRLHDRLEYIREGAAWRMRRLAP